MNKPFYGVASMPKSHRCTIIPTQPSSSQLPTSPAPAHTISIKKKPITSSPNGPSKRDSNTAAASKICLSLRDPVATNHILLPYLIPYWEKAQGEWQCQQGIKVPSFYGKNILSQSCQLARVNQSERRLFLRLSRAFSRTGALSRAHLWFRSRKIGGKVSKSVIDLLLREHSHRGFGFGDKDNIYKRDQDAPGPGSFEP